MQQVGIGVDASQPQIDEGLEKGGGEQQKSGDGQRHQLGGTKSITAIEMLVTARAVGMTTQRQRLALDKQVARRTDDHGTGLHHTIQPVEAIGEIYPKTGSLSCLPP